VGKTALDTGAASDERLDMEPRSVSYLAAACGGELRRGSPAAQVQRVCTDSRQARAGDLFIALAGPRYDGHDFVAEVAKKAAAVVLEERGAGMAGCGGARNGTKRGAPAAGEPEDAAVIVVDNTRRALGRLGARYRSDFTLPMIAVGGSNGKTTTKELLASVLKQRLAALWSEASFNNDIGVPLTLLRLEETHQAAVVEVGTNHPGELYPLVRMVRPSYGVLTSLGREHLEFFADMAGVAREEGVLGELLPPGGKLWLNGDSEWGERIAERTQAAIVRVGLGAGNDWRVRSARLDRQGVTFRVDSPLPEFDGEYRVNLLGRYQAVNALFAIAVGAELGLDRGEIERGLAECKPARMRMQYCELNGVRVLDDAYNANVDSMLAALETLQELPCKGRRVAVLGDMAELGAQSEAAHEEVGRRAAELGVGQLFAIGSMAPVLARGARGAGLNRVLEFGDVESAAAAVKSFVKAGDVLLVKASRATGLERVTAQLRGGETIRRA
jgi:UDP-N-acetylmuramoyl-tripeptide--D-alanyl-D-alanine ligase